MSESNNIYPFEYNEQEIVDFAENYFKRKVIGVITKSMWYCIVLFEIDLEKDHKGVCYKCGRPASNKNNSGNLICNNGRKSGCRHINICPVCGKLFVSKKSYDSNKVVPVCSFKCNYENTLTKWHKEHPEESHKMAVEMGKKNGGIAFSRIAKENPELHKEWAKQGGIIGGKVTASLGYWKKNLDNSRYWDKNDPFYYTEEAKIYRKNLHVNGGRVAGRKAVETGQIKDLFTKEAIEKAIRTRKENGFYNEFMKFSLNIKCNENANSKEKMGVILTTRKISLVIAVL